MSDITFSRLPLAAGSALASSLGRFGLWGLNHYMRAPLASTGLLAMVTLTALAGSNALYFQTTRHPAPLFAPAPNVPRPADTAAAPSVVPEPARLMQSPVVTPVETGSVAPAPVAAPIVAPAPAPVAVPDQPVGNAEVFAVQKKLHELGLFEGTVDGYYGPMTARAIRAFEERNGRQPTGALERGVIDAILGADARGIAPQAAAAPVPQPAPAVRQAPVEVALAPVVQPAPDRVQRLPEVSPAEAAFDTVTETAATTIDAIVAAVDRETPAAPAVKPVPALPLLASTAQPMPQPVQQSQPAAPQPPAVIAPVQNYVAASPVAAPAPGSPANDTALVTQIQRGLASLGFLAGPIDGQPGEATAKAIRSFEVFHNYEMTGQITPELPGLLRQAGATI